MSRPRDLSSKLESLNELDFESLKEKAVSLLRQNQQLENTLLKLREQNIEKRKTIQPFEFERYKKRHIALKFSYLGWDYGGLVPQYGLALTVMDRMFDALEQCRLVQDRNECEFSVCGRTDKGVSGLCQVVTLISRSLLASGTGIIDDSGPCISERHGIPEVEMDYVSMLNQNLPRDIRVLAWSPVSSDFSARFDCLKRTYEYYFPEGGLDIKSMVDAGSRLVGVHDFRNFCASRIEKETVTFVREIFEVSINLVDGSEKYSDDHSRLYRVSISASGFLYHQIRYIASVLFMVGRGYESPSVVDDLLDLNKTPAKPQYQLSADFPLLFITGEYPESALNWETSEAAQLHLVKHYQKLWSEYGVRSAVIKRILDFVESSFPISSSLKHHLDKICPEARFHPPNPIKKLSVRQVEPTLDEKIQKIRKKRKMDPNNSENVTDDDIEVT
ncbi:unnamed protein product [Trichobilharzia szidati]|nr:unnamed protein product [Trichobilharzia szidati]